jgi:ribitol-5-phosphate 2-dehydrogenase (NADP+)
MLYKNYRLVAPQSIDISMESSNIHTQNDVVIRPLYMSICAADQRYYQGKRSLETLREKLPLTLIHECVGKVIYDPQNKFKINQNVVIVPNMPTTKKSHYKENYRRDSLFASSSRDGFMQDLIFASPELVIPIEGIDLTIAPLIELVSVAVNATEMFKQKITIEPKSIGIWGSGSMGFIQALVLKEYFPKTKLLIFGTSYEKNSLFSFVDQKVLVTDVDEDLMIDHAFECVGGPNSGVAVNQIIDHINPQGVISLMGVSEEKVALNTRMVLEKGLTLIGHSRSTYDDFVKAVEIVAKKENQNYLENIISEIVEINDTNNIHEAFKKDISNSYKTIMKWNM